MRVVGLLSSAGDRGGQWEYESALLRSVNARSDDLRLRQLRVRNVRSREPGELRLPAARLAASPLLLQRAVMAGVLPRRSLVHRCDLRLPVAAHEVLTIHDTAWRRFGDAPAPPPSSLRSVQQALAVIVPSQFAADEVSDAFPGTEVVVARNGVDPAAGLATPLDARALAELGLVRPFVLCSGGSAARKNTGALLEAWAQLAAPVHQLAITGCPGLAAAPPGVVLLPYLDRAVYLRVLAAADGVVVPSLYEGFGLPVTEAMAAGKPVLATNRASLPEIAGGASLLCEPDAGSLAQGLRTLLFDQEARAELTTLGHARARELTWEESASIHLRVYRSALSAMSG